MALVGIDIGTSFIKGGVLDADALEIRDIRRVPFPEPLSGLSPLRREFDAHAVLSAVESLLAGLLVRADNYEGILMCSQMHALVFATDSGKPRSSLVTWEDQRALQPHPSGKGTYLDVMQSRLDPDWIGQLGNEVRPGQPLAVLFWLAEQGLLPRADVIPASLPDFVLAHLCNTIPTTEVTNAAAHGALNMETLDWHHAVLARLGLEGLRWPAIRAQGEVIGSIQVGSHQVPCYTAVGDHQCALAGAFLVPGELSINMSTGSQVSLLQPRQMPAFGHHRDYQTRPFFDGRFLSTITHIPAGRALNALVRLLLELAETEGCTIADPWPAIARKAAEAGESEMRVNLAFFDSASGDRGEITRIRETDLTVGHLFRAAFQNLADNYYDYALRISPEQAWRNLVFSGGLARIQVLRQLIRDKFQKDYRRCPTTEDTLMGLLVLALAFTGRAASVQEAMARLSEVSRAR